MYDITYQGRTLRLSDRDYEQLERRFDPKRYRKNRSKEYFHNRSVCICSNHNCSECPFYEQGVAKCLELLRYVSGLKLHEVSAIYERVYVYSDNLDGIKKVHDVLLTATKVEAH